MTTYGYGKNKGKREVYTKEEAVGREDIVVLRGVLTTPGDSTLNISKTFSYPTGFNMDNSLVIGLMSKNPSLSGDNLGWTSVQTYTATSGDSFNSVLGGLGLKAHLNASGIKITLYKASTDEESRTYDIKVVLMKYEVLDSEYTLGDVNGDGKITQEDADLALDAAVGNAVLTEQQFKAADINKDGKVDTIDSAKLQRYVSGESDSL